MNTGLWWAMMGYHKFKSTAASTAEDTWFLDADLANASFLNTINRAIPKQFPFAWQRQQHTFTLPTLIYVISLAFCQNIVFTLIVLT